MIIPQELLHTGEYVDYGFNTFGNCVIAINKDGLAKSSNFEEYELYKNKKVVSTSKIVALGQNVLENGSFEDKDNIFAGEQLDWEIISSTSTSKVSISNDGISSNKCLCIEKTDTEELIIRQTMPFFLVPIQISFSLFLKDSTESMCSRAETAIIKS